MKVAIVFLTSEPKPSTVKFANLVQNKTDFDVVIVSDIEPSQSEPWIKISQTVQGKKWAQTIQVDSQLCRDKGYFKSSHLPTTHIKKDVIAFDKFLYFFCLNMDYDFVWVFEEDCFIPGVETLQNLQKKYGSNDLVTANNFKKTDRVMDWHWSHIIDKVNVPEPFYYSMSCAVGLSRAMLDTISKYVETNKKLFFLEVMLNTLAMQNSLKVCDPLELKSVVWQGLWGLDEFLLLPNNVFHPLKEIENHYLYRAQINRAQKVGAKPENNLPEFIKNLM